MFFAGDEEMEGRSNRDNDVYKSFLTIEFNRVKAILMKPLYTPILYLVIRILRS